jgi:hypothetical protein
VLEFSPKETAGGTEVLVVVDELVWIAHADPSDDDALQGIRQALLGADRPEPPSEDRPIDG